MTLRHQAALAATLLCVSTSVGAQTVSAPNAQSELSLSIYQNGLGYIRDARKLPLEKGTQEIIFEGVSPQMIPDSLLLSGKDVNILERRFAFDLLSPQILLEKSIGQNVQFRRLNPVSGKDELISAKLLAANPQVIIERDGQIEVGAPGALVLNQLPEGLRAKPALLAKITSKNKQDHDLTLAYLSNGLGWQTSYSVEIAKDGKSVTLKPWANLTNTSGGDYKNVSLQLAAGTLNKQSAPVLQQRMLKSAPVAMAMMDGAAESMPASPEAVGGLYLYQLPGKVDLLNQETKQVALMESQTFKSKRVLVQRFGPVYGSYRHVSEEAIHPDIELSFKNESDHPLPQGMARLYRADQNNDFLFVGEDHFKATPKNNEVTLKPGKSFDVSLKRIQSAFEKKGERDFAAEYKVTIKNAKKEATTLRLEDQFPGEWQLEKSTIPPKEKRGQMAIWEIELPANSEREITYRVSVKMR